MLDVSDDHSPMDRTAKWTQSGGEGIPPAQGAEKGNWLGISPRTAALAVLILLAAVMGTSYFTGFPAKLRRAAAPAPRKVAACRHLNSSTNGSAPRGSA